VPPLKTIRVQKLFLIALCLKIASSGFGWWLNDPWILGFAIPLLVMAGYVAFGLRRHESDVSDEKFADSCYYLGFIFTITSIVFSLFDLPQIGEKISLIAVRFGAAMLSTVAGLIVRVYLVNFREDPVEALRTAEESVLEAHGKLREQLVMALEKMQEFQSEVDAAAKGTVERVNIQLEGLSHAHGRKLQEFFEALAIQNRESNGSVYEAIRAASVRLSALINSYAESLEKTLAKIDERIHSYSLAVTDRLKHPGMAEEIASHRLGAKLTGRADRIGLSHERAHTGSAPPNLSTALRNISSKAAIGNASPANVIELHVAESQQHNGATHSGPQLQSTMAAICASLAQQQHATSQLTAAVESILKRDVEAAMRLSALDHTIGDAAGRLLSVVHALGEIAKDVRTIGPAFETFQRDVRAVRDAVSSEIRRGRARLGS
jgi:hypothetical protein